MQQIILSAKNENRNYNFSPVYSIDTNDTDAKGIQYHHTNEGIWI